MMIKEHLLKSEVTYRQHTIHAIGTGFRLIWGGITSLIHGIFPMFFDGHAPRMIIDIYHDHLIPHKNKEYKEMITDARMRNNVKKVKKNI